MQRYTIKEASKLSGLPQSTLRYYEKMGLIAPIVRDLSSGHRSYDENDLDFINVLSCLNATGMSIVDMRAYLSNMRLGLQSADQQIKILQAQKKHLAEEAKQIALKQRYLEVKVSYWKAMASGNTLEAQTIGQHAHSIAKELK